MNLPSVTTILRPFTDPLLATVPAHLLDAAAKRGSDVHRIVCSMARGVWFMPVPEELQGYIESWQWWADRYLDRVVLTEPELVNRRLRFCGHPDLVCIIKGDTEVTVIDLKTPRQVRNSWKLQISAYRNLVEEDKGIAVPRSLSMRLHPEGKPPLVDEFSSSMASDFNIFHGMLNAWWWFHPEGQGE